MDQEYQEYYKKGLTKAQFVCSKQEKCITEIIKKLFDWKIPPNVHQEIIQNLIEDKFINEERFTKFYVRDKFMFNRWGKTKISHMLRGKSIDESLIHTYLDTIDKQEYINTAKDLLKAKLRSTKEEDPYKLKSKIFRHLQAKGFEYDIIINVYEDTISEL